MSAVEIYCRAVVNGIVLNGAGVPKKLTINFMVYCL